MVGAQEVGAGGEISWRGDRSAERGDGETMAVMRCGAGARIVARSARPWLRVRRIFSDLAVFEVVPQGLAIVELAPGISAREVQTHAQPTLLVSSRVKLMVTGSS